ncbi:MAG: virulence protein RhuM/Fic/DOC family protein [Syntrophobacterales bacterium]|nr:virulence protein RhuM/Fic/DOC family protein [Syntrophobacterales bacterium]
MKKQSGIHSEPLSKHSTGAVVLYNNPDGTISLDVRLEKDTLWLNLNQIASLFDRDKSVISRHLNNVFREGELDSGSTVAFFATVQDEGRRIVERQVENFNLDAILSVGYRVNSKRGTQFRIWATQTLRDHILKGYSVNQRRLKELRQSLKLVGQVLDRYDVTSDQARALLQVVTDYSYALDLLDDYDHQRVSLARLKKAAAKGIDYQEALIVIEQLRCKFGGSDLFGREKDDSLPGSLGAVMQTFNGRYLYRSLEEKDAHLLYFLVKNHSFVDGNKRIAALFLWLMEKNGILYCADGSRHIADNALVAITLMIAESKPEEKDVLTKVVVNLITGRK